MPADITSNLILHCPLDETSGTSIADATAIHAAGTFNGTLSTTTGPSGGTAIQFNGTTNYISFADANDFDVSSSFTVAYWAKVANGAYSASGGPIMTKLPAPDYASGWDVYIMNGAPSTVLRPVGVNYSPGAPDWNDGNWHHIAHVNVYSGGNATTRHYIDGRLVSQTGAIPWSPVANTGSLLIGTQKSGDATRFSGALSDMRLYTRALSSEDVEQLANVSRVSLLSDLIAYYPMWESSGNLIDVHRGLNLTETSGTISSATGKVQLARDFEEADSEWFGGSQTALRPTQAGNFTIAAWVRIESFGLNNIVCSKGWQNATATNRSFVLYRAGGVGASGPFTFGIGGPGGLGSLGCTAGNPVINTWYWVLISFQHSNLTMTIGQDNVENAVNYSNGTNAPYPGATDFEIGSSSGQGLYWDGLICEFGYWNRILTAREKAYLYNSGAGRTYPFGESDAPSVSFF